MPNRILKESICRSDSIDSLSWFEEVLFYRLIVVCDDYGRFDGRLAIIRGSCFPLKDIRLEQIEDALKKLAIAGMIRRYETEDGAFLQLIAWERHQQIRAKRSKYPAPDNNGYQLISDDCKCPRNPIQSESNPNRESGENVRANGCVQHFDEFWSAYPLKKNMIKARGEYAYVLNTTAGLTEDMLISAAKNYAEACRLNGTNEQYMNYPNNWLKESVWMDYLPENYKRPKKEGDRKVINNNFQNREYDYDDLESRLLGSGGKREEKA